MDLRMVLCYSMNTGSVVRISWDVGDTQTQPYVKPSGNGEAKTLAMSILTISHAISCALKQQATWRNFHNLIFLITLHFSGKRNARLAWKRKEILDNVGSNCWQWRYYVDVIWGRGLGGKLRLHLVLMSPASGVGSLAERRFKFLKV